MNRKSPKEAPDPIDIHVGLRIKQKRIGLGMSQTKLGDALGVTFQQVQKYENGSNRVSASSLYRIAETLGVDVACFFEGIESRGPGMEDPHDEFVHDPMKSREAIELMHSFSKIEDEQVRKHLFHFVKSITKTK